MKEVFGRNVCKRFAERMGNRGVAVALLLLASASSSAWAVDSEEWETLSKGLVVVKQMQTPANTPPAVEAKILITKPPEKVWPVVADPEKLMREEEKVKRVKVLTRTANQQNVEFSVMMTRLLPTFNYVLLQELSPPSLLRFHRVSGSFKDIQGSWKLLPVENGSKTVLTYTLRLDAGPLIPKTMLMAAVKSDLPSMMRNAKTAIDKNTK